MMTHPFIRTAPTSPMAVRPAPVMGGGGGGGMMGGGMAARPVRPAMRAQSPMGSQRTEIALGLARQRALAQALRGGMTAGVPQATPNPGIVRPQGLPMVR